jgi:glycine/D-amino acid oxidase-like deaminating enzyme
MQKTKSSAKSNFDVIILGGGIVGCACARECALAGMRVALVEADGIAGGATGAAMGHIVVMDGSPAQLALTTYSRALWMDLREQLPPNIEYEMRGTIWIAADEQELAEVYAKHNSYSTAGIDAAILDSRELAATEPNLRKGLAGGLLVPGDGVNYPPAAATFFLEEALRAGTVLLQGQQAVSAGDNSLTLNNGDSYNAKHIVIATGAYTGLLLPLNIQRRKGHLSITEHYPGFVQHQLVELGYLKSTQALQEDSVAFNIQPRQNGQLLIGSSRQYRDNGPGIEDTILARMHERACEYMPELAKLSVVRSWTGYRAATPDKLPLIGPTEDPSVVLAMGFEGLGITSAPAAARLVVDNLLGRVPAIDASPYLPARLSA